MLFKHGAARNRSRFNQIYVLTIVCLEEALQNCCSLEATAFNLDTRVIENYPSMRKICLEDNLKQSWFLIAILEELWY